MNRREALATLGTLALAACTRKPEQESIPTTTSSSMPVVFAAHGAPPLLDDAGWMSELAAWAKAMPKPSGVLMVSAHWEHRPTTLGATTPVPLVYDFYGFPARYYETKYAPPDASTLAGEVRDLLRADALPFADDPRRGLDHGAYVPLVAMYPAADVPVLQLSMPALDAQLLFRLGRALAPLRDRGVLVFGSGFLTHNLSLAGRNAGIPQWARDFDAWSEETLTRFDVDALMDFHARAPASRLAHPTWEHYAPLLVAVGAAAQRSTPRVTFPITGWWMNGPFTRRSVQLV